MSAGSSWKTVKLGDVAKVRDGRWTPGQGERPYVALDHIWPHELRLDGIGSSSECEGTQSVFQSGDVLYGKLRPYQRKCVRPNFDGVCSTEIWPIVSVDDEVLDQRFLFWVIAEPRFTGYVSGAATGTRMPRAIWRWAKAYEFSLPPISEQRLIADALDALTDRVSYCMEAEGTLGELIVAEVQDYVERESVTGEVSLLEAIGLVNGGAYTKNASGTGRMVVRIKDLSSGPSSSTIYNDIETPPNKTAFPGDILFSWSGTLGVWRWYREEAIVNQHIFKVTAKAHPCWLGWAHVKIELAKFQAIAAGKATTMGHITQNHLQKTMVPAFSPEQVQALASCVTPLWDHQLSVGLEMRGLLAARDRLAPLLVAGEIRLPSSGELATTR